MTKETDIDITRSQEDTYEFKILILGDGNFSFSLALARFLYQESLSTTISDIKGKEDDVEKISSHSFSLVPKKMSSESNKNINSVEILLPNHVLDYLNTRINLKSTKTVNQNHMKVTLCSTSFDSRQEILKKYPESKEIIAHLDRFENVQVRHGINAWELSKCFPGLENNEPARFDVIAWNHPHLGTEDFRLHRFLMAHFFSSVESVLKRRKRPLSNCTATTGNKREVRTNEEDPTVCVSVVEGQDDRWDLVKEAERTKLYCESITRFDESLWPGYVVKRNKNGKSFKNVHTKIHVGHEMRSRLYQFTRRQSTSPEETLYDSVSYCIKELDYVKDLTDQMKISSLNSSAKDLENQSEVVGNSTFEVSTKSETTCTVDDVDAPSKMKRGPRSKKKDIPADQGFPCQQCGRVIASPQGLKNHIHTVHTLKLFGENWCPDSQKQFQCDFCEKLFSSEYDKWQHQVNKHTQVKQNELPEKNIIHVYNKELSDQLAEEKHVSLLGSSKSSTESSSNNNNSQNNDNHNAKGNDAHAEEYEYYPCEICGQAVINKSWGMILHLETLKPIIGLDMVCPKCDFKFIEQRALIQHYKFCRLRDENSTVRFARRHRIAKQKKIEGADFRANWIVPLPQDALQSHTT